MKEYILNATRVSLDRVDQAIILSFGQMSDIGDILGYVMLQKSTSPNHDSGVYIEINDQINSGYRIIKELERTPEHQEIY